MLFTGVAIILVGPVSGGARLHIKPVCHRFNRPANAADIPLYRWHGGAFILLVGGLTYLLLRMSLRRNGARLKGILPASVVAKQWMLTAAFSFPKQA